LITQPQRLTSVQILDSDDPDECLPLYLRPNDPMCVPILSHNTPSNNLLLKVTLPKRTGRKRKRGSQDPYTSDVDTPPILPANGNGPTAQPNSIRSQSRLDTPAKLLHTLRYTVDTYSVEVVGEVKQTHRFRGTCSSTSYISSLLIPCEVCLTSLIRRAILNLCRSSKRQYFRVIATVSRSCSHL
jgi:general transcription factor 3C polypeptide 5 (transcription factor C subunit 1)